MSDEGASTGRSVWLREFLARNDVRCEQCGYSLQHIVEPMCPECGFVIPRPGTDEVMKAAEGTRPEWRMWCIHCGQDVRNVKGDDCPGCGKSLLVAKTNVMPREGAWFLPGVPLFFVGLCGAFVLMQAFWVVFTLIRPGAVNARAIAALCVSLVPCGAAWAWSVNRKMIADRGWSRRVAGNAYKVGFLCLGVFLVLMVRR